MIDRRQDAYRPDIDGLRCIAVMAVVVSHVDLSGMQGGFVGVDVFFVISGFLITRILMKDLVAGNYSILRFYERRARRILPALIVMIAACFAVATVALGPAQFVSLAESAAAATLFASNVWFWQSSSGYFGADVDLEPLLHTWSLGVEEQFYIVFPLLLVATFRLARRHVAGVILVASVVSLVVASWQVLDGQGEAAFYLLHSRAWELGAGALVALAAPAVPERQGARAAIALLGAAAVLVPVFLYRAGTPFPGLAATPPVLGTAALIWINARGDNPVKRVLASRPFVGVGLISYSVYLWHWPVIVYAKVFFGELTPARSLACIGLSLILGALSWQLVEQPFRGRAGWLATRRAVLGASGVAMAATVGVSVLVWAGGGFAGRLRDDAAMAFAAAEDIDPRSMSCMGRQALGTEACRIGAPPASDGRADFLLWGDSHAGAALPGVARAAELAGRSGFAVAFPACPPLLDVMRIDQASRTPCPKMNAAVLAFLESRDDMPLVLLVARWALAAEGTPAPGENMAPALLADAGGRMPSGRVSDNFPIFEKGLRNTIAAIRATGREVVVVGGIPEIGWSVPERVGQSLMHGLPPPAAPTATEVGERLARADALLRTLATEGSIRYLPVAQDFCPTRCDMLDAEARPLYRDEDHLSRTGAVDRLTPLLMREVWSAQTASSRAALQR